MQLKIKQTSHMIKISTIISILSFILVFTQTEYQAIAPYLIPLSQKINNWFALTILLGLFFPGVFITLNMRHRERVESTVPVFLKYISEKIQTGVFIVNALEDAIHEDFGPLNKPLEKALSHFHLTNIFSESMELMSKELDVLAADSLCSILVEAYETGGDLEEVLTRSVELFGDVWEYKRKRNAETSQYVAIIYLGVGIFCVMAWMLLVKYFDPLMNIMSDANAMNVLSIGQMNLSYQKSVLFWAAMMEALFGGLVAGKISKGKISSGTLHSFILVCLVVIVFNLF